METPTLRVEVTPEVFKFVALRDRKPGDQLGPHHGGNEWPAATPFVCLATGREIQGFEHPDQGEPPRLREAGLVSERIDTLARNCASSGMECAGNAFSTNCSPETSMPEDDNEFFADAQITDLGSAFVAVRISTQPGQGYFLESTEPGVAGQTVYLAYLSVRQGRIKSTPTIHGVPGGTAPAHLHDLQNDRHHQAMTGATDFSSTTRVAV